MKLDLRNAANSLQIEGKGGVLPGDPTHQPIGGGGWRDGGRDHMYMYIYGQTLCRYRPWLCDKGIGIVTWIRMIRRYIRSRVEIGFKMLIRNTSPVSRPVITLKPGLLEQQAQYC